MPLLATKEEFRFDPVHIKYFYRWRDAYISRNTRFNLKNGKEKVDLSDENLYVTFKASKIWSLIENETTNGKFLTVQFMCQGNGDINKKYNYLSAAICIMDNKVPITPFILPIGLPPSFTADIGKKNYKDRKDIIKKTSNSLAIREEFERDEDGIAHEITNDLRAYFFALGDNNVKVIFVKVPELEDDMIGEISLPTDRKGRLTVVFVQDDFEPDSTLPLNRLSELELALYDFGQGCCPPQ
ncbi:hypothetical protein [Runella aurantiaca]|uniref:Uncharacterized protein n=1 Tax=Runella aurantiaca TaxID=2282308 RepID=A0A369IAG0_9BACT|nr:hypothetical protein [Runella aurantiaca]RDB03666.1 hypothetical protein DVG78_22420 [Runella aurantiaca]